MIYHFVLPGRLFHHRRQHRDHSGSNAGTGAFGKLSVFQDPGYFHPNYRCQCYHPWSHHRQQWRGFIKVNRTHLQPWGPAVAGCSGFIRCLHFGVAQETKFVLDRAFYITVDRGLCLFSSYGVPRSLLESVELAHDSWVDHHSADCIVTFFLSQICFIKSVELIGPGRAGVFVNLVPIFSSLFAVSYLGESFEFYHGLALLMVFSGIFLFERFKPL